MNVCETLKASGAVALLFTFVAHTAPLPKAPRDEVIEIECVGHVHQSNETISWSAMIGSGVSPGAFWARIDRQTFLLKETATSFIIEGQYGNNPPPDKRFIIDIATGQYAAYRLDGDKMVPLHASLPVDRGCWVSPWKS